MFRGLFILTLASLSALPAFGDQGICPRSLLNAENTQRWSAELRQEEAWGVPVQYTAIDGSHSHSLSVSKYLKDDGAIFLGIDLDGHAYLVAGGARFDGGLHYSIDDYRPETDILSAGIVFKISVPEGQQGALKELMADPGRLSPRGATCVGAVCRGLRGAFDLRVSGSASMLTPRQLFRSIARHGLRDTSGRSVPVEILVLGANGRSLETLTNQIDGNIDQTKKDIVHNAVEAARWIAAGAIGALAIIQQP